MKTGSMTLMLGPYGFLSTLLQDTLLTLRTRVRDPEFQALIGSRPVLGLIFLGNHGLEFWKTDSSHWKNKQVPCDTKPHIPLQAWSAQSGEADTGLHRCHPAQWLLPPDSNIQSVFHFMGSHPVNSGLKRISAMF